MLPENKIEGGSEVTAQQQPPGDGAIPTAGQQARAMPAPPGRPSTADLLRGLADDAATLVRQEVTLARQEMTEGLAKTAMAGSLLVAAGVLALYAFGFLLASAAQAIGGPSWLGPLIIGGGLVLIAAILGLIGGVRLKKSKVAPAKAREELRLTANQLREEISGRNRGGNGPRDRVDAQAHGGKGGQAH
jgi:Putative Actinobacterial Holin-X, holin superfamily III